ncbi:MAG TPA: 6-phosphogluconolactonase [Lysobacter sp.]|nr:6-phosphogluconolactonase [Lysobacter sp.]
MTDTPSPATVAAPVLHTHPNAERWAAAAAEAIARTLCEDLASRPRARLLVSGGTTPAPVYAALSQVALHWSRVDVALVDERWLHPDDPDSNARLVREHLLQHGAAEARFEPLTQPGRTLEDAVAWANAHAQQPAAVAVLGMGDDGHTASLFPGMHGLERALSSERPYVAVDARDCPGARQWARRISLTPAGLRCARERVLLLRGTGKRAVLERALADGDPRRWPVLVALGGGAPLQVHWCP